MVFSLGEEQARGRAWRRQAGKAATSRTVQDIGEVRRVDVLQDGFSIAVELTGLGDSDVDELIRATNAASLKAGGGRANARKAVGVQEGAAESAAVEGV